MPGPFRDELEAAQERIARLEEENRALRSGKPDGVDARAQASESVALAPLPRPSGAAGIVPSLAVAPSPDDPTRSTLVLSIASGYEPEADVGVFAARDARGVPVRERGELPRASTVHLGTVGDRDGDGRGDVAMLFMGAPGTAPRLVVRSLAASSPSLDVVDPRKPPGSCGAADESRRTLFGPHAWGAGDVDGDGLADVVVPAGRAAASRTGRRGCFSRARASRSSSASLRTRSRGASASPSNAHLDDRRRVGRARARTRARRRKRGHALDGGVRRRDRERWTRARPRNRVTRTPDTDARRDGRKAAG